MNKSNGSILHSHADATGIPLRTLEQVKTDLAADAARDPEIAKSMARTMLRFGRLTEEARKYVRQEYPE